MTPKLYIIKGSAPARTVLIAAKAIGLNIDVEVLKGNGTLLHTPEYFNINPIQTAPFIIDNGHRINDSHAIVTYLVGKYAKDDSLYPKDVYQRALVDEKLYFDTGILFPTLRASLRGFLKKRYKQIPQDKIDATNDSYRILEKLLQGKKWLAGNNVTIADISCATTTTSLNILHPIDRKGFSNVDVWLKRVQSLPFFKGDDQHIDDFKKFVKDISN